MLYARTVRDATELKAARAGDGFVRSDLFAIVDDDALRSTISKGRRGTAMSAFAQKEGGMLTDEQVNAIIRGIRERWSKPNALAGVLLHLMPRRGRATRNRVKRCTQRSARRVTAREAKVDRKQGR